MAGSGDRTLTASGRKWRSPGPANADSTAASAPNHARDYKVTLKCDGVVRCVEKRPGKT